jgi:hypothetical protein
MSKTEPVIELVQLENGDIALRNSDEPEQPLLTINFSEQVREFLQNEQLAVAQSMVEAGINSYRLVQLQRVKDAQRESANRTLH